MQKLFAKITPFIVLGIAIVAFIFGLVLLSYLLFFGAMVGLALFAFTWIKEKFFPPKALTRPKKHGRTLDHDDFI